jgi:hypothetical protein
MIEKAKIALAMVDLWETNEDISVTEAALRKLGALAMKERNRKLIRIAGAIPILCDFLRNADPSVGLTPDQSLALQVLALLCRNGIVFARAHSLSHALLLIELLLHFCSAQS